MEGTLLRWSVIVAECGTDHAGYVRVYRKYAGRRTDDGDKVNQASFCRHLGIAPSTFNDWLKRGGPPMKVEKVAHVNGKRLSFTRRKPQPPLPPAGEMLTRGLSMMVEHLARVELAMERMDSREVGEDARGVMTYLTHRVTDLFAPYVTAELVETARTKWGES